MSKKIFSVFNYTDYKLLLAELFELKAKDIKGVRTKVSEVSGMSPTYMSQVVNGKAHLTEEQALPLTRFFAFSEIETRYFEILLRLAKAGTRDLKNHYEKQRRKIIEESKDLKNRLKDVDVNSEKTASIYYSHWYFSAIHIALYIPEFKNNIESLQNRLGLSHEVMNAALQFLLQTNLIKQPSPGRYEPLESNFHLPKHSPHILKHHINWRMRALDSFDRAAPSDFHYSSVISIAKNDVETISQILVGAVEQSRELIAKSNPDEVLCAYCIDFFEF